MAGIFGLIGAAAGLGPSKPEVPPAPFIDTGKALKSATQANIGALPGAEGLSSSVNAFNEAELQKMLEKAIPNYSKLQGAQSDAILSLIKGEIPDANQIAIRSAERAVGGGFGGTEAGRNLTLRDLSMSSLAATQAGLAAADRWTRTSASIGVAPQMNPTSMFISPAQELAQENINATNAWQRDWLSNRISAAPSYLEQQAMGTLEAFDQMGQQALGMWGGGMLGGAMGSKAPPPIGTEPWVMS